MKRTWLIFIAAAMLAAMGAPRATAQADWNLVNFDLINLPREPGSHPLTYTMYADIDPSQGGSLSTLEIPMVFGGELIHTRSIGMEEKKKAVRMTLDELGWDFNRLREVIRWAAQADPKEMTNEEVWDEIAAAAGLSGVGDLLGLIAGVKDRGKYIEDKRKSFKEDALKSLVGEVFDKAGKLFNVVDHARNILKARERDKQKWINRVAEANMRYLATFYRLANQNLWGIAQEMGETWVLRVKGSVNAPFLYEDVACVQQWTIRMELTKNYFGKNESLTEEQFHGTFAGEYIGWLEADALYSLENWDAQYLIDKQLRLFMQTEVLGLLPHVSDARFDQSLMKVRAENYGYEFKHDMLPTQAHNTYRLPVKVEVKQPEDLTTSIYTHTHVFMGDEEWIPGEKPRPLIETKFQMKHNVSFFGEWGDAVATVKESWFLNHYATRDSIIAEGNRGSNFSFDGLGTLPLRGKDRYSEPIGKDGFGGRPNGTVRVHLDQSLSDLDARGRIRYK